MNSPVTADPPTPDLPDLSHSLMERSPVPMAELEGAGHVLRYVNPAFCRLMGKSKAALLGQPFADTVQAGDGCLALLARVYRTGEAETHTEAVHAELHSPYWSYAMWPVLDAEHHPVGVMVQVTETTEFHQQTVAMNEALLHSSVQQHELTEAAEKFNDHLQAEITARKHAEKALGDQAAVLQRSNEELQRINTEFQQFAYIVSHDLSEPLRTMNNFTQLLAQQLKGKLDDDAEECMAFVTEAAQRMQQMLSDLLAYTRVGGQDLAFAPVDGEALLAYVCTGLQMAIDDAEAEITHDPLPTIQGDATRLGQVLQNLIGNALKFRGKDPSRIHVSAQRDGNHWRFSVRDNGVGIDPTQAGRLFQVFQRLHTHSEYPGTGIGLAICKRIVEQHGGRIWVDSKPRKGSIFHFTIQDRL